MVFGIFAIAALVLAILYLLFSVHNVKKNGLETVAEVSEVTITEDYDGDTSSRYRSYRVTYQDSNGNTVEAYLMNNLEVELANRKRKIEKGQKVKIKYLPEKTNTPVFIELL